MKSEPNEIAHRLDYDVEHYERLYFDWNEDLIFQKYDGYVGYKYYGTEPFPHPEPVIFLGHPTITRYIDYPQTDNGWTVMSRQMYQTLLSVGDFPHRIIPVAVVDWSKTSENWYNDDGKLRRDITQDNFLAIQMTEHLDIFDYEKSNYTMREDKPDWFDDIKEFVFKTPSNGLPPIFKIPQVRTYTFVSAEAREAMKKAGITGPRYISLKGSSRDRQSIVDNPIKIPAEVLS